LRELQILKLEDELKLSEIKLIWRWEKNKLPLGLRGILLERPNVRLRSRQFERPRLWKNDSISYRLATCAIKEIKDIEIARSKKGLTKKYRKKDILN